MLGLFPDNYRDDENSQAVLCALSILPPQSLQQCCYDILSFIREKNMEDLHLKSKLSLVVYLVCIESLKSVVAEELFDLVFDEKKDEYITYLQVDAIICRAIIYEIIGEHSLAADDLNQLALHVLDNVDSDIDNLKLSLQTSMIYALCRLPLVERLAGMLSESLASFKRCISGDSVLKSRISAPMKTALTFSASMLLLQRARMASTEENALADVQTSFSLLQGLHANLIEEMRPSSLSSPMPLEHLPQSLVLSLPSTDSSPESVTAFASPSRIAILLSCISKRCEKNVVDHTVMLEWGASFDVQLDTELLWSMANSYIDKDDVDRALPVLEQVLNARMRLNEREKHNSLSAEFSDLVSWLRIGPNLKTCPWLPLTRYVDLYIERLCKPKIAIDFLLNYTAKLYPSLSSAFNSLVDISGKLKVPRPDPLYLLMTRVSQGNVCETSHDRALFSSSFLAQNVQVKENDGMLAVLFSAARALGCASRSINDCRAERRVYREAALTVLHILITHYKSIEHSVAHFPVSLVLEYSVLLAENNEIAEATLLVKEAVRENQENGPLIHLLSLLLSHAGGSPEIYATAVELCSTSLEVKPLLSTGLTLSLLQAEVGQLDLAVESIDKVIVAIRTNILDSSSVTTEDLGESSEETKSIVAKYCLEWDRSPQSLRLSIEILMSGSKIYRRANQLEKAKDCTDLALKLLYTVNLKTISGLEYTNKFDRAELLRKLPQVSGWKLKEGYGFGSSILSDCVADVIAECAAQVLAESGDKAAAEELCKMALIDFPFHVPILLDLAEFAIEKSVKERAPPSQKIDSWGVPVLSFDDCFMDVVTRVKDELKEDSSSLIQALRYASLALRMDDESFDTWYIIGKIYEALSMDDQAKVAFWKAMDLEPFDRVRNYDCVLLDSLC